MARYGTKRRRFGKPIPPHAYIILDHRVIADAWSLWHDGVYTLDQLARQHNVPQAWLLSQWRANSWDVDSPRPYQRARN
jgi:hypothetical protein